MLVADYQIGSLLMYLFGALFIKNLYATDIHTNRHNPVQRANILFSVLVFIITLLLLSADFYYLKNIAGRRLVGLRWWNEVNTSTGDSHWVFESSDPNVRTIKPTDKRFFWLSLYATPALWVGLAMFAILRMIGVIWLSLIGKWHRSPRTKRLLYSGHQGWSFSRHVHTLIH